MCERGIFGSWATVSCGMPILSVIKLFGIMLWMGPVDEILTLIGMMLHAWLDHKSFKEDYFNNVEFLINYGAATLLPSFARIMHFI